MMALAPRNVIEREVRLYRATLARHPKGEAASQAYSTRAQELFRMLVERARKYLHASKDLLIIPDGILYYFYYLRAFLYAGTPARHEGWQGSRRGASRGKTRHDPL